MNSNQIADLTELLSLVLRDLTEVLANHFGFAVISIHIKTGDKIQTVNISSRYTTCPTH